MISLPVKEIPEGGTVLDLIDANIAAVATTKDAMGDMAFVIRQDQCICQAVRTLTELRTLIVALGPSRAESYNRALQSGLIGRQQAREKVGAS